MDPHYEESLHQLRHRRRAAVVISPNIPLPDCPAWKSLRWRIPIRSGKNYRLTGAKRLYTSFYTMMEQEKPDIVILCSRLPKNIMNRSNMR